MPVFKFLLQGEISATIVELQASDRIKAYVRILIWMNSQPKDLEELKYTCSKLTETGKTLIFLPGV